MDELDEKIKRLATKEEIKTLVAKAKFKAKQDKIVKLETHDLSYFLGNFFFGDNCSQNMFVYETTFVALELKVNKSIE